MKDFCLMEVHGLIEDGRKEIKKKKERKAFL
jgi:hypothetical protein